MEYRKVLEMELEKLDREIEVLERKAQLLKPLAEDDEEIKLELIGTEALLSLYKSDRAKIASLLA
jgi:hypothetical protein